MNKNEIIEIGNQLSFGKCPMSTICGCYVDSEKGMMSPFRKDFLYGEKSEISQYLKIFKKIFSGKLGVNLFNINFDRSNLQGDAYILIRLLYDSELRDQNLLNMFYKKIISSYEKGDYLILLMYSKYDIPEKVTRSKKSSGFTNETYSYMLHCICPLKLSLSKLIYGKIENIISNQCRNWKIEMPVLGYLYPAFNERSSDTNSLLFYQKKSDGDGSNFVEQFFGTTLPLSIEEQRQALEQLVCKVLGQWDYDNFIKIREAIEMAVEEKRLLKQPLFLEKEKLWDILVKAGATEEKIVLFDQIFEEVCGQRYGLYVDGIVEVKKIEIENSEMEISFSPQKLRLLTIEQRNGEAFLVIPTDREIKINGFNITTLPPCSEK